MRYPLLVFLLLASFCQAQEYKFPAGVYPGQQDVYPGQIQQPTPEPPKPQNFRETIPSLDLKRVGCKLRPDLGSGVNTEYGVITCWHCVESGKPISVECDGEIAQGTIAAYDVAWDIALINVPWKLPHPVAPLASGKQYDKLSLVARSPDGYIGIQQVETSGKTFDNKILLTQPTVAGQSGGGYLNSQGELVGIAVGNVAIEPFKGMMIPVDVIRRILPARASNTQSVESASTPQEEIDRVLSLLPKPRMKFVDFGCGSDARWCISAARKWECKCVGIEIDPVRAKLASQRVTNEGLDDLIQIYCADSTKLSYDSCDVGVAYLYQETLDKLKPQIEKLRGFASYIHKPPIEAVAVGDSWLYIRPSQQAITYRQPLAVWGNQTYSGRVCNNPNCGMCASIQAQLSQTQSVAKSSSGGRYVTQKVKICNGRSCWFEDRQVWIPDPQ